MKKITKFEDLGLVNVHDPILCQGTNCVAHNPSDHHMRDWHMNWRGDKGVMERICPHGIGHPDPDDAMYQYRAGRNYLNIHGCDWCCDPLVDHNVGL